MYNGYMMNFGGVPGFWFRGGLFTTIGFLPVWLIALLVAWSLVWKGLALWKAARDGSRNWFTVLLLVQTLGILEILYLYVFSKPKAHAIK